MIDAPVARITNRNVKRLVVLHPVSWQRYHAFRNDIVRALRPYGTVGHVGEALITDAPDGPPEPWPIIERHPVFFIMDDQWYVDQLYSHIECTATSLNAAVIEALLVVTSRWKGALIHIALGQVTGGSILVCTGRLLVQGPLFPRSCKTALDVLARCQGVVDEGARGRRPTRR